MLIDRLVVGVLCPFNIKLISVWVPTCDSMHPLQLYSAAPLGKQAVETMTLNFTIYSHYTDNQQTGP